MDVLVKKPRELRSKRRDFIADVLSKDVDYCVLWPFAVRGSSGYGVHNYIVNGKKINVDAHRFVCTLAHGAAPEGVASFALHSCHARLCVNPKHLHWGSHTENMRDMALAKRQRGGGRWRPVAEAKKKAIFRSAFGLVRLGAALGMTPRHVAMIRKRGY